MKILYAHLYESEFGLGGAAKGVFELILEMSKDSTGQVIACVNQGELADKLKSKNISVCEIPKSKWRLFKMIMIFKKEILNFKPDVIHSHHRFTTFVLDVFFGRKIPVLHTERVQHKNRRLFYRYGTFATTVSEGLRNHLIKYYKVPADRVQTIQNAVQIREANTVNLEKLKKEFLKKSSKFYWLCVGRLEEQKGHIYLIQAVEKLPKDFRDRMRVLLVGGGSLQGPLQKEAYARNLESCFVFLGYRDDIPELLSICDGVVLPSLWEGLPRTVIEAFVFGKPVIATDIAGTSDIIQNGVNGLLIPPKQVEPLTSALKQLMVDSETRFQLGKNAKKESGNYSFERLIKEYRAIYHKLIQMRREDS